MRKLLPAAFLLLPILARAQDAEHSPRHADRLEALARLDAAVRYFHPIVATRATTWDSAFADNALRVADAATAAEYSHAIGRLVAQVGDPATRVTDTRPIAWTAAWLRDSVLLVRAAPGATSDAQLIDKAARARAVIIDFRGGDAGLPESALARVLLTRRTVASTQRALQYSGFPTVSFRSSGGYGLSWRAVDGEAFEGQAVRDQNVSFIVDSRSVLPALALVIRSNGRGPVVGVGTSTVTAAAESYRVTMGEGISVDVRLGNRGGAESGVQVDTMIADPGAAVAVATRMASRGVIVHESARADTAKIDLPPTPVTPAWTASYPAVGYRVLAAARLWNTIRLFYPYKDLMGESWDAAFRAALPAIEGAGDELDYGKAIAAFAWHIHDSHVNTGSAALYRDLFGQSPAPVLTRIIEDKLIVTRIIDSSASRDGLDVGDEIVTIDGESVPQRIARLSPFLVSSTPQALRSLLGSRLLYGRAATPATSLTVRNASGTLRKVELKYATSAMGTTRYARTGSIVRTMPGNVGYVDLERLPVSMVDSMFKVLANTNAIVFDMRGYPQGTAWAIAPRLNTHSDPTVAARFRRLIVPSPDTLLTTTYFFEQPIPAAMGAAKYTGRTAMLIDERAISQAEHTGLFFEAANGTAFIGSPTTGANGDVTNFILPGSISISFTGHDVRHADGRQLQRVGIAPTVQVLPTVAGIRAGHDEVLEAGLKYMGGTGEVPRDTYVEPPPVPRLVLPAEPLPEGWAKMGNTESYRIGADRSVAHGGQASGHVTALEAGKGFGALNQTIVADEFRGKRVRFAAFIKTRDAGKGASQAGAGIWMRVDGAGGILAFDNMGTRPIVGTTDWQRVSVVLDVPEDAVGIALGLLLSSGGEAWIDDASLEVVGSDVPSTGFMEARRDASRAAQQAAAYSHFALRLMNLDFERWQ